MPWYGWLLAALAAWCVLSAALGLWLGPRLKRIRETETRKAP
jgi:uncharacterized membrane protein YfcA